MSPTWRCERPFYFLMKFESIFGYLLIALAVWRITSLLIHEAGPYNMFHRLRYLAGVRHNRENQSVATNELAKLFLCHWCMSWWVALVFTIGLCYRPDWLFTLSLPFALSAVSILITEGIWPGRHTEHS